MAIALEPFDPSRNFVAQNSFRAGGRIHLRKRAFDKSCVNERVLGQLYEARQIAYAKDEPPALVGDTVPETPDQQHEAVIAEQDETTEAVADKDAPVEAEAAAAPAGEAETAAAAVTDKPQLDHDHDGEAGGSEAAPGGTPEEQVKRLCGRYNRKQLLSIAHGLELAGDATKPVIAEAIVKAGLADNEPA